jgi:hypothetical protein
MPLLNVKYKLVKDRVEIYRDFTINLINYIFEYYLDKNTLSSNEDIYNHYTFCYNKVCDEFLLEEIDFKKNEELINYFFDYFYYQVYKVDDDPNIDYLIKFWNDTFSVDTQRSKGALRALVEIYLIFDKSITQEKNILELV